MEIGTDTEKYQSYCTTESSWQAGNKQFPPSLTFAVTARQKHTWGCQWAPTENDLYWPTAAAQESAFAMRLQDCNSKYSSEFPFSLLAQVKVKEKLSQLLDTPSCWHSSWMEHSRAGQILWMGQNFQPQEATVWISLPPSIPTDLGAWEHQPLD